MADLKEIYEDINEEVINDISLGATSDSKEAEHRKIIYTVSEISRIHENRWDVLKEELQDAADAVPTCNDSWWEREIKRFQYGHTLLLDSITRKYYYEEDDEDARIVTRVAVTSQNKRGIIKVAKAGPAPLESAEKTALDSYIKKVQPTGANITLISQAADEIKMELTVYFDPIVPQATVQTNVETAINDYLASLAFNVGKTGTFYISYLVDAIQAVEGVVDVTVENVEANQDGEASLLPVLRKYVPIAGYLTVHPDHALADTITYTSEP